RKYLPFATTLSVGLSYLGRKLQISQQKTSALFVSPVGATFMCGYRTTATTAHAKARHNSRFVARKGRVRVNLFSICQLCADCCGCLSADLMDELPVHDRTGQSRTNDANSKLKCAQILSQLTGPFSSNTDWCSVEAYKMLIK